jgi:hypothetical protein
LGVLDAAQRAWSDKLWAPTNSGRAIAPGLVTAFGEQQVHDASASDRRISGEGVVSRVAVEVAAFQAVALAGMYDGGQR